MLENKENVFHVIWSYRWVFSSIALLLIIAFLGFEFERKAFHCTCACDIKTLNYYQKLAGSFSQIYISLQPVKRMSFGHFVQ
jgi:hypothetical protein